MNKKLIALAVASLISVPAFAAGSEVQFYGMLDAGVDSTTNVGTNAAGTASATNNVGRVSDYGSYFGLKGSEDLGNGLSGIWQIEQGVSVNGGNTNNSTTPAGGPAWYGSNSAFGANPYNNQRNTFVGLSSQSAGTVLVGIHDSPYKMSTAQMDPFADTLGDYNGLVGSFSQAGNVGTGLMGGAGASGYFDLRPSQVLAYVSPNMSGLTVVGAYVFGNATNVGAPGTVNGLNGQPYAANSSGDAYSLAAMYTAGPLYLTASYEQHDFGAPNTGSLAIGGLAGQSNSAYKLGAAYSIMDTTLSLLYENSSDNFGTNGSNLLGHDTWYASLKHSMGAWDIALAYANAGSDNVYSGANQALVNGVTHQQTLSSGTSDGAQQWTIGGDYNFSKNTQVYALYTEISNDAGAMYNFADTTNPAAMIGNSVVGANISAVSLGIKHTF